MLDTFGRQVSKHEPSIKFYERSLNEAVSEMKNAGGQTDKHGGSYVVSRRQYYPMHVNDNI
jgi:hypothetical protein